MKTKLTQYLISWMLFASYSLADPGAVITENNTSDPGLPYAAVDGDLIIEDTDGNNSETPGLFVEGLSDLKGGILTDEIIFDGEDSILLNKGGF